ncbi:uncharacterized protein DS421_1g10560 [Arachis hypogaea]|nr:uncharacterized protein DS421_1g10560 [Arachis hypogaea]
MPQCLTLTRVEQPPSSHRSSRGELKRCLRCLPPPHSHSLCCILACSALKNQKYAKSTEDAVADVLRAGVLFAIFISSR